MAVFWLRNANYSRISIDKQTVLIVNFLNSRLFKKSRKVLEQLVEIFEFQRVKKSEIASREMLLLRQQCQNFIADEKIRVLQSLVWKLYRRGRASFLSCSSLELT